MINDPVIVASASAALASGMGLLLGMFIAGRKHDEQAKLIAKLQRDSDLASSEILNKATEIAELQLKLAESKISDEKKFQILDMVTRLMSLTGINQDTAVRWAKNKTESKKAVNVNPYQDLLAAQNSLWQNARKNGTAYDQMFRSMMEIGKGIV